MSPGEATKEFIEKFHIKTAGNLIDALEGCGWPSYAQHFRAKMMENEYLSRSSLVNNFLRDIGEVGFETPEKGSEP